MKKIRNCLLIWSTILLTSCSSDDFSNEIEEINSLKYGDEVFQLSQGLEEVFKLDDNHSSSQINITDGEFYSTQVVIFGNLNLIWRARNASVWMYIDMYAPGFNGLGNGTYEFRPNDIDENEPTLANIHFFKKGKIALDLNNDGEIERENEFLEITGGNIKLELSGDDYIIEFNLKLENGVDVNGVFTGNFNQV